MKKSCLNKLKFWEASRNLKRSLCWKFQLSISLGTQKSSSTIQAWAKLNKPFWFFEKNGSILGQYFICPGIFWAESLQKNLFLCSWEITEKFFCQNFEINFQFSTLWIWLFGIFDNARRGAMRSKPQWVFYSNIDWWPGPQKNQFGEITGYPEVVGLILALLRTLSLFYLHPK